MSDFLSVISANFPISCSHSLLRLDDSVVSYDLTWITAKWISLLLSSEFSMRLSFFSGRFEHLRVEVVFIITLQKSSEFSDHTISRNEMKMLWKISKMKAVLTVFMIALHCLIIVAAAPFLLCLILLLFFPCFSRHYSRTNEIYYLPRSLLSIQPIQFINK